MADSNEIPNPKEHPFLGRTCESEDKHLTFDDEEEEELNVENIDPVLEADQTYEETCSALD